MMFIRLVMCISLVFVTKCSFARPVDILKSSGVKGGLVVHLDCGDAKETGNLLLDEKFMVHGLTTNPAIAQEARKNILEANLSGKISIGKYDGIKLPYTDSLVNCIICQDTTQVSITEILRVLAPLGKAYINGKEIVKPWPKEIDEWTHYLNGPHNNAVAQDEMIGQPRSLKWTRPPRWGRSHEELASMSAMVSAQGRLFYIIDDAPLASLRYPSEWKLVACDAFNGKKLWERSIKTWIDHLRHFRSGPVHLPRRLIAVGDKVFVTLGLDAPVTMLDAATGETLKTFEDTEWSEEIVCHNNILYLIVGASETLRSGKGLSTIGEPKPSETRYLKAIDINSGHNLWTQDAKGQNYILSLSLTAYKDKVIYQSIKGITCLDARSGEQEWMAKRQSIAKRHGWSTSTLVIAEDIVLCSDRVLTSTEGKNVGAAKSDIVWGIGCFSVEGLDRTGTHQLIAYSIGNGRELWSIPSGTPSYNAPVDLFVINSTVWLGPVFKQGYDLKTGKVIKELNNKADPVGMSHHRCYREKASTNFIFTGKDGIEFIDLDKGWIGNNSWVRGTCQYGILPANGLIYASPDACGCHPKTKLQGFNALSSKLPKSATGKNVSSKSRLHRGPAYDRALRLDLKNHKTDWPMYRHDSQRSGAISIPISGQLKKKWTSDVGGKLTQAVSAYGKVFIASIDTHTVYGLDIETGTKLWVYSVGSRVDSAPTLYKGLVIFGSSDGYVHCLDSNTGELVWQFCGAPEERLISIYGQLESSWPIHGSVLLHNEDLVFTAGRSTYLDGGLYFYRLNPVSGEMLATSIISHIDPVTGKQTGKEVYRSFDSEGTQSDIMTSDGTRIFIKHMVFDKSGNEIEETAPHLFTGTGFLGEEWFVRAFWLFGTDIGAGYGRWANMKSYMTSKISAGRILCFNDNHIYGYGRIQHQGGWTGHRGNTYHTFSSAKKNPVEKHSTDDSQEKNRTFIWSHDYPFIIRSMALTSDKLLAAALPAIGKKTEQMMFFDNPKESLSAFKGELGASLLVMSSSDGKMLNKIQLEIAPVFDGMSAADNKLFISLKNGTLNCYE